MKKATSLPSFYQNRSDGADLGPPDQRAARGLGRPPGRGQGVCAVTVGGGQHLLASAADDRTVRIWDPRAC